MMKTALTGVCVLVVLAGLLTAEVVGKALDEKKQDVLKVLEGGPTIEEAPAITEVDDGSDSPCVYKGRYFTVDVRKPLSRFK